MGQLKKLSALLGLIFFIDSAVAQTTYYSKSSGNLNVLSTWGTNADGSGVIPVSFVLPNCTYIVVNQTAATIGANWTVSGTNSNVQVGDGSQTVSFTMPNNKSLTGNISVMNNGTLNIASNSNPTITSAATGSTIIYSRGSNQNIENLTYYKLVLSGSGTKSLANTSNTIINGALTINTGIVLTLNTTNTLNLTLNGTVGGAGTIKGGNSSNLTVGGSTGNLGTLLFNSSAQTLYKFTIMRSGSVTLGCNLTIANAFTHSYGIIDLNGFTLTLNGAITFPSTSTAGSFSGSSASSLSIGGSGAVTNSMFMTQSGTANHLNTVILNRTGQTFTLGNKLELLGSLTPTAGTFASAGNLILDATSYSVTAYISSIGASANVTGNVTVQSYAKGGNTGWTTMGAAGISGRTFSDWDDNITITCLNCPDGYNIGGTNFGSVLKYSETVGGLASNAARYTEIQNITDPTTIGTGYWVYLGNGSTTTSDIILDASGPVNQGNFNYNLTMTSTGGGTDATDHGYNLIANPYPSPIQWSLLRNGNTNVDNAIYVYNPDLGGYASYVNGVSSPATGSGGIGDFIPAGQAFYVKANAATTLTAIETYKGASTQELLRTNGQQQITSNTNPIVFRLKANGNSMQYETAIYFDANATNNYDNEYDAIYMGADYGKLGIATSLNGYDYSINGMPALNQNFSIPVKVTTGITGSYQVAATDLQNIPSGACIILHDNYTNVNHNLRSSAYSCTVTDTETVARFVLNISINNNLQVNTTLLNPTCSSSGNGFAIANANSGGPWNYYWKDASNSIIKTSLNRNTADTLFNLNAGNYSLDVNTTGTCDNGTQNFSLQAAQASSASFIPSASSVILIGDTVPASFTNTSSNANTYWWSFGNGNGSADTNAVTSYASTGDYTVTLTAYNTACGDSTVSTQVITVVDPNTNGIAAYAEPTKNMFISRDANGYYVQFNYNTATNAIVSVQNILGEKIISDLRTENISSEKIYIPLGNSENKILILSVVTGRGEKTYCKTLNY